VEEPISSFIAVILVAHTLPSESLKSHHFSFDRSGYDSAVAAEDIEVRVVGAKPGNRHTVSTLVPNTGWRILKNDPEALLLCCCDTSATYSPFR